MKPIGIGILSLAHGHVNAYCAQRRKSDSLHDLPDVPRLDEPIKTATSSE